MFGERIAYTPGKGEVLVERTGLSALHTSVRTAFPPTGRILVIPLEVGPGEAPAVVFVRGVQPADRGRHSIPAGKRADLVHCGFDHFIHAVLGSGHAASGQTGSRAAHFFQDAVHRRAVEHVIKLVLYIPYGGKGIGKSVVSIGHVKLRRLQSAVESHVRHVLTGERRTLFPQLLRNSSHRGASVVCESTEIPGPVGEVRIAAERPADGKGGLGRFRRIPSCGLQPAVPSFQLFDIVDQKPRPARILARPHHVLHGENLATHRHIRIVGRILPGAERRETKPKREVAVLTGHGTGGQISDTALARVVEQATAPGYRSPGVPVPRVGAAASRVDECRVEKPSGDRRIEIKIVWRHHTPPILRRRTASRWTASATFVAA